MTKGQDLDRRTGRIMGVGNQSTVSCSDCSKNEERPSLNCTRTKNNNNSMIPHPLFLLLVLFCSIQLTLAATESRVVCYYTNWSAYRQGPAKFLPDNINPYLCTHLVYAFGGLTSDSGIKPFDKYQDIDKGGYTKFNGLKTYNKALKTLIAIGGWNEGSRRFSTLVADPEARKNFIKHSIRFLRQHHFDGLDLDWEYPASREGSEDQDKPNYAKFIEELREAFEDESKSTGRSRLLLTIAVPAGIETIDKGFDIPSINRNVDFFNLLTYDYHASTEPTANHHAPLKGQGFSAYDYKSQLNIEYTVQHYIKEGADADKLVIGLPTYGRSYTLFNVESTDVGAPASGPGTKGKFTKEPGYLAYYEICEGIKAGEWRVENEHSDEQGPHAINNNQWVGYDDTRIVALKAKWVREMNLGGIMFWSVDNDDFRGSCHGKPFPLIEAAKTAYYINENAPSSSRPTSRFPSKSSSSKNRLRFTTPAPPSTTTGSMTSRKKKPKTKNSNKRRRPKPRATQPIPTTTPTTTVRTSTTPVPPTTPDPGVDFECKDEGFFPHPRECKKYFWCLDAPGLGLVAHHFTCPAGLFFNKNTDSCDYARNVPCKPGGTTTTTTTTTTTSTTTEQPTTTKKTTTTAAPEEYEYYDEEEEEEEESEEDEPSKNDKLKEINSGKSAKEINDIKDLLRIIKKLGGVEELEKYLEENPSVAKAVKDFSAEEEKSESNGSKKASVGPNRFTSNRSTKTRASTNSSPVINPLRYTNIQRTKPSTTSTTTSTTSKYSKEDEEEEEDDDDQEEEPKPPVVSRFKPKENKYSVLNRDKKTSSTETSVVVRYSADEKLLDNDDKRTTERPYVTISRPYAKVDKALRYVSLARQRPSFSSGKGTTDETDNEKKSSDANNGAEEIDDEEKAKSKKEVVDDDATEEESEEEEAKPASSTTTRSTSVRTTSTISAAPETSVSTQRPRIRIPTRKTLGFTRTRNTIKSTSPFTSSTTTTTSSPLESASSRRSRAFATGNRRNILTRRTTTSTTPIPDVTEDESESTDESPATVDEVTSNRRSSTTPNVVVTSSASTTTTPLSSSSTGSSRSRSRNGQENRPRLRNRQRNYNNDNYSSTKTILEYDDFYPSKKLTTTLSPFSSDKFQTAVIRRRTRRPNVLTTTTSTTRRPSTTTTTSTTPKLTTRYAPNVSETPTTDYVYYYYEDDDEDPLVDQAVYTKNTRDDLLQKSQSVRGQFSKRTLDVNVKAKSNSGAAAAISSDKIEIDKDGNLYCLDKGIYAHPKSCKKFIHCVDGEGADKDIIRGWIYSCPDLLTFDSVGGICNWSGNNRNLGSSCTE